MNSISAIQPLQSCKTVTPNVIIKQSMTTNMNYDNITAKFPRQIIKSFWRRHVHDPSVFILFPMINDIRTLLVKLFNALTVLPREDKKIKKYISNCYFERQVDVGMLVSLLQFNTHVPPQSLKFTFVTLLKLCQHDAAAADHPYRQSYSYGGQSGGYGLRRQSALVARPLSGPVNTASSPPLYGLIAASEQRNQCDPRAPCGRLSCPVDNVACSQPSSYEIVTFHP